MKPGQLTNLTGIAVTTITAIGGGSAFIYAAAFYLPQWVNVLGYVLGALFISAGFKVIWIELKPAWRTFRNRRAARHLSNLDDMFRDAREREEGARHERDTCPPIEFEQVLT